MVNCRLRNASIHQPCCLHLYGLWRQGSPGGYLITGRQICIWTVIPSFREVWPGIREGFEREVELPHATVTLRTMSLRPLVFAVEDVRGERFHRNGNFVDFEHIY